MSPPLDAQPRWAGPEPGAEPIPPPAPAAPAPGPWGIVGTIAFTLLIFGAIVVSSAVAIVLFRETAPLLHKTAALNLMEDGDFFWQSTVLSFLFGGTAMLFALALRRGYPWREYLALKPAALRQYLLWGGIFLAFGAASEFALRLLGVDSMPPWMKAVAGNIHCRPCFFFAIVLAAPLLEEAIFRGFVLAGLRTRLGVLGAVFWSAAPWAALHVQYQPVYIPVALGMGIIFGLARVRSGSLLVPLSLHCLNNAVAFLQMTAS